MDIRGVSGVVTAVLLILLAIGAIAALWVVIASFVSNNSETIGEGVNAVNLDIDEFYFSGDSYYVKVSRDTTKGDVEKVRIVLEDSSGSKHFDYAVPIREGEKKPIPIDFSNHEGINPNDLKSISILPVSSSGSVGKLGDEISGPEFTTKLGLILYLPFDDDTDDHSGNEIEMTNVGAKYTSEGRIGGAYVFKDDDVDYIENTEIDPKLTAITDELTVSAWVKSTRTNLDDGNGLGVVVNAFRWGKCDGAIPGSYPYENARTCGWLFGDQYGSSPLDDKFHFAYSDGTHIRGGWTNSKFINNFFTDHTNEWVFVTGVYKTNEKMMIYLNGESASPNSIPTSSIEYDSDPLEHTPLRIGHRSDNTNQGEFVGSIDEVRIYNKTLTEEEIKYLFEQG